MKKIISALTVPLFFVSAYSQNSMQNEYKEWEPSQNEYINFDISKYITPDIVRNQLDINFNFNSYNLRTDYSESNRDNKYESSSYTGNISSYFSHYVNTRKKISSLTVDLSFGGNYYSYKDKQTNNLITIDEESSSYQLNPSLDLSWLNKWYFSKLIFLDYGINGTISYNFKQNKIKNQSEDSKQKDFSLNISPQVGIGYGRIENVQDARQAVYIADALSKRKVLTRNLSNDELFELSQIISTVKNKRFLDSRLHLIDEITSVDSFFVNNKLLTDNGVAYFTTLYDMWNYGALFSRKSGYEISLVARPYFGCQNIENTYETRDVIQKSTRHIINLDFSYEKP
ncbi:MAG: hypothetical protein LBH91_02530, partial [Prevotellaceae bacterium]|nr:hypothetical protein [Prevotellaceae bacterium]